MGSIYCSAEVETSDASGADWLITEETMQTLEFASWEYLKARPECMIVQVFKRQSTHKADLWWRP